MGIELGIKLRKRRQELGLTLQDIGRKMGVDKSTVSRWEKGHTGQLKKAQLDLLAKLLYVDPSFLLSSNNSTPPEAPSLVKKKQKLFAAIDRITDVTDLEQIEIFIKAFIKK